MSTLRDFRFALGCNAIYAVFRQGALISSYNTDKKRVETGEIGTILQFDKYKVVKIVLLDHGCYCEIL